MSDEPQDGEVKPISELLRGSQQTRDLSIFKDRNWITPNQLSAVLGISYMTVLKYLKNKQVISVKVGGGIRIYEEEVRYILENGTRPGNKQKHQGHRSDLHGPLSKGQDDDNE